jgi:hypothetical protein
MAPCFCFVGILTRQSGLGKVERGLSRLRFPGRLTAGDQRGKALIAEGAPIIARAALNDAGHSFETSGRAGVFPSILMASGSSHSIQTG